MQSVVKIASIFAKSNRLVNFKIWSNIRMYVYVLINYVHTSEYVTQHFLRLYTCECYVKSTEWYSRLHWVVIYLILLRIWNDNYNLLLFPYWKNSARLNIDACVVFFVEEITAPVIKFRGGLKKTLQKRISFRFQSRLIIRKCLFNICFH